MAIIDAELPITRSDVESTLRAEGYEPSKNDASVWLSPDRTKFVQFTADGTEAIYGDSEIGEPGRVVRLTDARATVRGELLLDSPLGIAPSQQPRSDTRDETRVLTEGGATPRALPPRQVAEAEFEPDDSSDATS